MGVVREDKPRDSQIQQRLSRQCMTLNGVSVIQRVTHMHRHKRSPVMIIQILKCSISSIFWQICKIPRIAMGLSVAVCMCVCVHALVIFFRKGRTLAKIKDVRNDVCSLLHLPLNGVIAKIVLRDLDLHLIFKMFKICEILLFSYVAG